MAFYAKKTPTVGDTVKLLKPITIYNGTFEPGTTVKLIEKTDDGFRISDNSGHTASGLTENDFVVIDSAEDTEWTYETGHMESEIFGQGYYTCNIFITKNENLARQRFQEPINNYLIRYINKIDCFKASMQKWDNDKEKWV